MTSLSLQTANNQAQNLYNAWLTAAYRNGEQLFEPGVWLQRDPEVEDKMLRDADIKHAVGYRQSMIAGSDWEIQPDEPRGSLGPLTKEVGTALVKRIKGFTKARRNLAIAFFSGARYARIHGQHMRLDIGDGKWRTWWVPVRLEDMRKHVLRIKPHNDGENVSAHWQQWNVAKGEWQDLKRSEATEIIRHIYDDDQETLSLGKGLREALGWIWYAKTNVFQDNLSAISRYGGGLLKVAVDGFRQAIENKSNEDVVRDYTRMYQRMRESGILIHDANDTITVEDGNGQGWQLMQDLRQELRSTIFTLVLGANLTTSADKGGSYALAEVQQDSTELIVNYDREALEESLSDGLMRCVWSKNRINLVELGIADSCPRLGIVNAKRQDPQLRAEVARTMSVDMGLPLAEEEVYEQTGFRVPEEGEKVIRASSPVGAGMPSQQMFDWLAPQAEGETEQPVAPQVEQEAQDTALNGAQVQAAADIIDRVVSGLMPAGVAKRMLVSMFNLPESEAEAMVREAEAFVPTKQVAPEGAAAVTP